MKKQIPVIHTIAVCENSKTKKRVICDIFEREGKITIEYDDKSYPANMYSPDLQKAISIVFKLDLIKQYHFRHYGKVLEEINLYNDRVKKR